jgi:arylsulfatase A-like enzyme
VRLARFLAVAALLVVAGCARDDVRPSRPSVILVSLDTLRPDHLSTYGYPRPTSPCLDAFAAEAVSFASVRCQSAGTLTSHLSLFTSRYPVHLGITRDAGNNATQSTTTLRLADAVRPLAEILSDAGWETAAFTGGGFVAARYGLDRGFDRFEADGHFGRLGGSLPNVAEFLEGRSDDPERSARPLFLFVHGYDVHQPYDAPVPYGRRFSGWDYREMENLLGHPPDPKVLTLNRERLSATGLATVRALYDNEVLAIDRHVGNLFAELRRHDLWEDAIVVVLSDHGEEFLEHDGFGHGRSVYEELARVPLIVRAPGARGAGRLVEGPAALLDVAPTVLELAGLPVPAEWEGRSLVGLVDGTDDGTWLSERTLMVDVPDVVPPVQALVSGTWKLVRWGRIAEWELCDLESDPGETRDLGPVRTELGAGLARELVQRNRALAASAREQGWLSVPQEARTVPADALDQLRALGYVD